MRKERAGLKQEIAAGRSQLLLPFEAKDEGKMLENKNEPRLLTGETNKEMKMRFDKEDNYKYKSGLDKMEQFVNDNFVNETISDHLKQMEKGKKLKVYQIPTKVIDDHKSSVPSSYDSLLDGAVPSHFMDNV